MGWRGNITINTWGNSYNDIGMNLLKSTINSINVDINVSILNIHGGIERPLIWIGAAPDYPDAYQMVNQVYSNGPFSILNYKNPYVDNLVNESNFENNITKRLDLINQIEETIAQDYYAIYLADFHWVYLIRDWIHNMNGTSGDYPWLQFQYFSKFQVNPTGYRRKI